MLDPLLYHPRNPFRPVDWRWHRAGQAAGGELRLSRRADDAWTHRAARFRRRLEQVATPWDVCVLEADDPDLYWAHQAWQAKVAAPGEHVAAYALEARLLAVQPHAEIAARGRLPQGSVTAYEACFFDVADAHDKVDYIAHAVMGPAFYRGVRARSFDLLWKLLGWGYGPYFVDTLLTQKVVQARPADEAAMQAALVDVARSFVGQKGLIAGVTVDVNSHTATYLITELNHMVAADKAAGREAAGQQTLLTNLGAMMAQLPFRVGHHAVPGPVADRRLEVVVDSGAAELRGEELMLLGAGREVPALPHLGLLAFPAPAAAPTIESEAG
jgi:hypothetical protein